MTVVRCYISQFLLGWDGFTNYQDYVNVSLFLSVQQNNIFKQNNQPTLTNNLSYDKLPKQFGGKKYFDLKNRTFI